MYVILVYDVGEKRVGKMLRLVRKYLSWIQNSVFEGEITDVKLKELKFQAKEIMDLNTDSLIIFDRLRDSARAFQKEKRYCLRKRKENRRVN
jgi:CRISPR-associated protein Cas2